MRLMTSRRSDVVGTPARVLFRPTVLVSPMAGPITLIDALPTCCPLESDTPNRNSPGVAEVFFQPRGASSPEGSNDGCSTGAEVLTITFFSVASGLEAFRARASLNWRSLNARRRAANWRFLRIRAWYCRHHRLEYFLYLRCFFLYRFA